MPVPEEDDRKLSRGLHPVASRSPPGLHHFIGTTEISRFCGIVIALNRAEGFHHPRCMRKWQGPKRLHGNTYSPADPAVACVNGRAVQQPAENLERNGLHGISLWDHQDCVIFRNEPASTDNTALIDHSCDQASLLPSITGSLQKNRIARNRHGAVLL